MKEIIFYNTEKQSFVCDKCKKEFPCGKTKMSIFLRELDRFEKEHKRCLND